MGKLFIVPTPIGNLDDITLRAIKILKEVDSIIAEDTRTTSFLLNHFNIEKKELIAFHKFNEHKSVDYIVGRILGGEKMALVSDAGTPGISDPGYLVVSKLIANNIDIECLPGPSALIPALVVSGLPSDRFCFEGFLPHKKGRNKKMLSLKDEERTMIFYESPFRVSKTIEQFIEVFGGNRRVSISREISKKYEETIRGTLSEVLETLKTKPIKGEIVICLEGKRK